MKTGLKKISMTICITLGFSLTAMGCQIVSPPVEQQPVSTKPTQGIGVAEQSATAEMTGEAQQSSPIPAETPTPQEEAFLPQYKIKAVLNDYQKKVQVQEDITFFNPAKKELDALALIMEPNLYYHGLEIDRLLVDQEDYTGTYSINKNRIDISLPQAIAQSAQVQVHLEFILTLPEIPPPSDTQKPQVYGFTDRQTNLVDWFAYIPPYDDVQGWLIHEPTYFGEYDVYPAADFEIDFSIENYSQAEVVAASVSGASDGDNYHYVLESGRNFAISVSPYYSVAEQVVGDTRIIAYTFPADLAAGNQVLSNTAEAYGVYSQKFGSLNRKSLSVVEADFLDGMEYQGLYFLSRGFYNLFDGTVKGYLTMIAVHETSHQWWYASVANDQAEQPWLDEAMATYSELVYYDALHPDLVDWWWGYRVNYYSPTGVIDRPVYDYGSFTAYRNAVYLDGAKFLQAIRDTMGDEAFFQSLQDYQRNYNGKIATQADLLSVFKAHSSVDLAPVLAQYFANP